MEPKHAENGAEKPDVCMRQRVAQAFSSVGNSFGRLGGLFRPSGSRDRQFDSPGVDISHDTNTIAEEPGLNGTLAGQKLSGKEQADVENGLRESSSEQELFLVVSPHADAVAIPSKAERQMSRSVSSSSASSSSASIENFISQHYNPGSDVVLRMEFIKEKQMKAVLIGVWVVESVGILFLIIGVCLKTQRDQRWFFRTHFQEVANVVCGVICWLALMACGYFFVRRLMQQRNTGKRWSFRRKRVVWRAGAEHVVVLINVTAYLVSNLYVVSGSCLWFSRLVTVTGAIQWSCWNATFALFLMHAHDSNPWVRCTSLKGFRPDAIIMDAPRIYHLTKFVVFLLVEGVLVAIAVLAYRGQSATSPNVASEVCRTLGFQCQMSTALSVLVPVIVVCFLGYFLGIVYYLNKAFEHLRRQPYVSMRMANQNVRLQARLRGLAMAFFVFCVIMYIFVGWGTCTSFLQSWLGFLPMYVVMTGVTVASTYLVMPNNPRENPGLLQVWLQEFSWSEHDLPARLNERKAGLCQAGTCIMEQEPMFCFETSMKMLYWSQLVYRYEEAALPGVTLEAAMGLYNLEHFELLWERQLDTKALMAWNDDTVVLSFRGTASFKNVLADLRAWYVTHPPARGKWWLANRPFVHQGFLRSWHASGLKTTVVNRVNQIVSDMAAANKTGSVRVFVTGHSLGGALATLAAFDIQRACQCLPRLALTVYTFGAPRTGNHAFAREYNAAVPNTWNVINDQDTIPRTGKFWILYKRPGQRVLINADGDMIVRPSFIEAAVQRQPTSSPAHHLLVNYQKAHIAIIKAQFSSKALRDGAMGVLRIAEQCGMEPLLRRAGIEPRDLRKLTHLSSDVQTLVSSKSGSNGSASSSRLFGRGKLPSRSASNFSVDFDVHAAAALIEGSSDDEERLALPPPKSEVESSNSSVPGDEETAKETAGSVAFQHVLTSVEHAQPSVTVDQQMAAGGDVDVDEGREDGLPGVDDVPNPDIPAAAAASAGAESRDGQAAADVEARSEAEDHVALDMGALQQRQQEAEGPPSPPETLRSDSGEVIPDADKPLQHYSGSMSIGQCRYTHFNGMRCKKGGRAADARCRSRPDAQGGFCWLKDRPKDADVMEGAAEGPFCSMTDRPSSFRHKVIEAVDTSKRRLFGK